MPAPRQWPKAMDAPILAKKTLETFHDLAANLRPLRQHDPLHPAGRRACGGDACLPGLPAHQGPHCRRPWPGGGLCRGGACLRHARRHGGACCAVRRLHRAAADWLDRAQHHLPAAAGRAERQLQGAAGLSLGHHRRPPPATAAHRLLLWRILRRRSRLRHTRGRDRRHPHRAGLLAPGRIRPEPDRQHRARGLWRTGHAGHHAGQGAWLRPDGSDRNDRPPTALLLPDGAVLADLGLRRAQGHDGNLARHPGDRPVLRHSAVPGVQLHRPRTGGHHRRHRLHGGAGAVPARLAAQENLALNLAQRP